MNLTPQDFVAKWKRVTSRERQVYQEHFIDLCHLVGHSIVAWEMVANEEIFAWLLRELLEDEHCLQVIQVVEVARVLRNTYNAKVRDAFEQTDTNLQLPELRLLVSQYI